MRSLDRKSKIKSTIETTVREHGYTLEKVILFGSRAKGRYIEESDWDILVIVKEDLNYSERKVLFPLPFLCMKEEL